MKINKDLLQKVIDKYGITLQTTVAMKELAIKNNDKSNKWSSCEMG